MLNWSADNMPYLNVRLLFRPGLYVTAENLYYNHRLDSKQLQTVEVEEPNKTAARKAATEDAEVAADVALSLIQTKELFVTYRSEKYDYQPSPSLLVVII